MDPRSLQQIFDELGLGGLTPPGTPGATLAPPNGPPQTPPYDTSVRPGTAFGAPYPGAMPTSGTETLAPNTLSSGFTPATGTETLAPASLSSGYTPQPRPELPRPLRKGPGSDMFAGYGDVYSPPPAEQDPLAQLMGDQTAGLAGFAPQAPPSRALTPPWAGGQQGQSQYGAGQAQIDRQAQHVMPTESEKALLRRSPAYARAINRIHALDRLRQGKGL